MNHRTEAVKAYLLDLQDRICAALEAEDGGALSPECRRGEQRAYLSFSVERPIKASTMAMIQKRMTMVGSFQPFCSK